jgi:hypothetical protein
VAVAGELIVVEEDPQAVADLHLGAAVRRADVDVEAEDVQVVRGLRHGAAKPVDEVGQE